ncbi:MAG: acyl--CoA ligase [Rhodoferax sp.]|nr:acyl--CoA ligase [Rhodoferax sp.]
MRVSFESEFGAIPELVRQHAARSPAHPALVQDGHTLDYAQLDALMERVAATLQRDGLQPGDAIAVCAETSIHYAAVFLGALRAGVVVAPLAPGSGPDSLQRMVQDARAKLVFTGGLGAQSMVQALPAGVARIALDDGAPGQPLSAWLAAAGSRAQPVGVQPSWPFNIIYSSGTTGEPKGIVQSHGMRWSHVRRGAAYGYGTDAITLLSTPLYSNTTLVVFFPTISAGGTVVLMPKFDVAAYLQLAVRHRVTHTMLVPVQYQRLMAHPEFDTFDLSSYRMKFSTSAPFGAALKADVLQRWPGGLVEIYGMTEGGGTCLLEAHVYPDKLHTVGQPALGHDIRLIDDNGVEVAAGDAGEVVGHSGGMMSGYHGQPGKTLEAEWFDSSGKRFIRTGDIGRFDADGSLILLDRKKDMLISGGFNVYPSDLEAVVRAHPAVLEVAVVGVPSERWGETPAAFVVLRDGQSVGSDELLQWTNAQLGKTQRLASLQFQGELPRSAIGKVLKRELRAAYVTKEKV